MLRDALTWLIRGFVATVGWMLAHFLWNTFVLR